MRSQCTEVTKLYKLFHMDNTGTAKSSGITSTHSGSFSQLAGQHLAQRHFLYIRVDAPIYFHYI